VDDNIGRADLRGKTGTVLADQIAGKRQPDLHGVSCLDRPCGSTVSVQM